MQQSWFIENLFLIGSNKLDCFYEQKKNDNLLNNVAYSKLMGIT